MAFVIRVPIPTSTNRLYGTRRDGGKYLSAAYRDWRRQADVLFMSQKSGIKPILGAWTCEVALPPAVRGDADNKIKASLDFLVRMNVVPDDKYCRNASAVIDPSITDEMCHLRVREAA